MCRTWKSRNRKEAVLEEEEGFDVAVQYNYIAHLKILLLGVTFVISELGDCGVFIGVGFGNLGDLSGTVAAQRGAIGIL